MELFDRIRPVTDNDKLEYFSYSKLDVFENCPYRYKLQYIDDMHSNTASLSTEIGTLLHKILEIKARCIMNKEPVNYTFLEKVLNDGIEEKTEKGNEKIDGINRLSAKYFEDFFAKDDVTGMDYTQKTELFLDKVIHSRLENDGYFPIGCEIPFDFIYNYGEEQDKKEVIFHGFIDSVRVNSDGDYKLVDYKSSKKVFIDSKIKTPMQMFIYDLACQSMYGKIPKEHEYDFILIDQKQNESNGVCSKGYLTRGEKKLNKLLQQIDEYKANNEFAPKPTPLCYWCFACDKNQTPNADKTYGGSCDYYSLWKPENKVFSVNRTWGEEAEEHREAKWVF